MYRVEYYTDRRGGQPVAEWLDGVDRNARANIVDKIVRLRQHGLLLLQTNMMRELKGYEGKFYELRYSSYRLALYYDTASNCFVLLHGFTKKRQRETGEIGTAYSRLREYVGRGQDDAASG